MCFALFVKIASLTGLIPNIFNSEIFFLCCLNFKSYLITHLGFIILCVSIFLNIDFIYISITGEDFV